jgi:hypothetical protein
MIDFIIVASISWCLAGYRVWLRAISANVREVFPIPYPSLFVSIVGLLFALVFGPFALRTARFLDDIGS